MSVACVIPARLGSKRFQGKVLVPLKGKPLLYWVWKKCIEAGCFEAVVIATDSAEIRKRMKGWGAEVRLTSASCRNGTERVAELAEKLSSPVFVNVQGDQPYLSPSLLKSFTSWFARSTFPVGTVVIPLPRKEVEDPNVVKVVLDQSSRCLYFSRYPIPYARDGKRVSRLKHVGIYGYTKEALSLYRKLPPPPEERAEKLEQLRFLHYGVPIQALKIKAKVKAIDTPADLPS